MEFNLLAFINALYSEGCKAVAAGMNPMDLKRGAQLAVDEVVRVLDDISRPITTKEEVSYSFNMYLLFSIQNNFGGFLSLLRRDATFDCF